MHHFTTFTTFDFKMTSNRARQSKKSKLFVGFSRWPTPRYRTTNPFGTPMASTSSLKMMHIPRSQPQKMALNMDPHIISCNVLERGAEQVVSHGATSQYNKAGTGAAACGLAALNFARVVFLIERDNLQLEDAPLLATVLSRECAEVSRIRPRAQASSYFPRKPLRYVHCGPATFILKLKTYAAFPYSRKH